MNKGLKRSFLVPATIAFTLVLSPLSAFASTPTYKSQKVIITFKNNVDPSVLKSIKKYSGKVNKQPKKLNSISATLPSTALNAIKKLPSVVSIEEDDVVKVEEQTVDWGINQMNVPTAKNLGYTGKGVKIAVLDTGISPHEDLVVSGGTSISSYTTSYYDDNGHGTHVAGIIGAKDNSIGTVGAAPDASIYAVKVLGANGSGLTSDIIFGIDWAIANKMNIINLSLGTQQDSLALKEAINKATNSGIIVVAAAGNDGNATGTGDTVDYPAKYDNVVAVGATDSANKKAAFSSAGPAVDVSAPGVSILSTLNNGSYGYKQGTSMATPYVSGIVALYKEAYPNYNASQIQQLLESNTIDLGIKGRDNLFGFGLVQAPQSKGSLETPKTPASSSNFISSELFTKSLTLSWSSVNNATSYELKRNGVTVYTGKDTSFTDKNLVQGTTYNYSLIAKNIAGNSNPAYLTIKTKVPVLTTPSGLKVDSTSDTINITWNKVTGASNYLLKRNGVTIYDGSNPTYKDINLTPGTNYLYELTAISSAGISATSSFQKMTTPLTPENVSETHGTTTAKLSWNPSKGATYYRIKNAKTGVQVFQGAATSLNLANLQSGYDFSFAVYAGNNGGLSNPETVSFKTIPSAPGSSPIVAGKPTQTSVSLSWKSIYNASSYELKRNGTTVYEGNALTFQDKDLSPGGKYTYTLTVKNDIGTSPISTVTVNTIPSIPSNLTTVPNTNSVSLKWEPVSGATYYTVKRNGAVIYKGLSTATTNTGLLSGVEYKYTVSAGNTSGSSTDSAVIVTKTIPTAPASPSITKKVVSKNSATIYWGSIYNAKTYSLKRNGQIIYTGSNLSFTDTGLIAGQSYTYSVIASNEVGTSSEKISTLSTLPNPPVATKITGTSVTQSSATLTWEAVTGASYYTVQLNGKTVYKGSATKYTIAALKANTSYTVSVYAGNISGLSSPITKNITTAK